MSFTILMIAFEAGRWGPPRLVQQLSESQFKVCALCPSDNALVHTSRLDKHFALKNVQSSRYFRRRLRQVLREITPSLVIPCDERTVAALHAIVKEQRAGSRILPQPAFETLVRSLAHPDWLDSVLLKNHTLALARELDLPVPQSVVVSNVEQAVERASKMGFPVYVKSSFSWAGLGTIACDNSAAVAKAFADLNSGRRTSPLKMVVRRLMARDWYPACPVIEVQKSAPGKPAMYCAVALGGKLLAGFSAMAEQTMGSSGPSTIVRISKNQVFEDAARKMIEATGLSGFVGFDFMWDETHKQAALIECNPRPIQVCHLGEKIGSNLCAALAMALKGQIPAEPFPEIELVVPLFPQEWLRNEEAALARGRELDLPRGDSKLLQFMLHEAQRQGRSTDRLKLALSV